MTKYCDGKWRMDANVLWPHQFVLWWYEMTRHVTRPNWSARLFWLLTII